MTVWIDADGCPVVNEAITLAREYAVPVRLVCDTAHEFHRAGAQTIMVSQGRDSADFALVNAVSAGDVVITQDYGLAAMCLARGATPLHQDGWRYTQDNIDALLLSRHTAQKVRRAGGRLKGPRKRTAENNAVFQLALRSILENRC